MMVPFQVPLEAQSRQTRQLSTTHRPLILHLTSVLVYRREELKYPKFGENFKSLKFFTPGNYETNWNFAFSMETASLDCLVQKLQNFSNNYS